MAIVPPTNPEFLNPSLYVGDLAPDVTESVLFDLFNRIGPVMSVRICRDAATRKSLGYGYVNFQRAEDAESCLENMNFERIRGRPCRIMRSQRDPTKRKSQNGNLFVKGLVEDVDAKILYDTFSAIGQIESVKVPYRDDTEGGKLKCRGYGFVQFTNPEHAQKAIEVIKKISNHDVVIEPFKVRGARATAQPTNVLIKNVPTTFTQEQFASLVGECGEASSVLLVVADGVCKGFGYADFKTPESANLCIEKLNATKVPGATPAADGSVPNFQAVFHKSKATLQRERQLQRSSGSSSPFPQGQNLYLKNLADDVTEAVLKQEFSQHGNIQSCKVKTHAETGVSLGFGFVCFSTTEEAEKALNDILSKTPYIFHGKPLYVAMAQSKLQRAEFLRVQRVNYYAMSQQGAPNQPFMPGMPPYTGAPYGMPPRDYGANYGYSASPSVAPANLVRTPQNRFNAGGYEASGRFPNQQGGQFVPQQGGQNRGPRAGNFPANQNPNRGAGNNFPPRGPAVGAQIPGGPRTGGQWQQNAPGVPLQGQGAPQQRPNQPQQPQQQQPAPAPRQGGALNLAEIARLPAEQAKRVIGETIFPKIQNTLDAANKPRVGKITGMLLEALDNAELLNLLEDQQALREKLDEALRVLNESERPPQ